MRRELSSGGQHKWIKGREDEEDEEGAEQRWAAQMDKKPGGRGGS